MARLNILEQQTVLGNQDSGVLVDDNIAKKQFQGNAALSKSLKRAGDVVFNYAEKMKAAKDFDDFTTESIRMNESFKTKLGEFRNRNDFGNFKDEYDRESQRISDEINNNNSFSKRTKARLKLEFQKQQSANRILVNTVHDSKQIEQFRADFATNLEMMRQDGDLQGANQLTREAKKVNIISAGEEAKQLQENQQFINFYNAKDFVDSNPQDVDTALKEFPVNRQNEEKIRRHAAGLLARDQKIRQSQFRADRSEALADPEFSLDAQIQSIDAAEQQGTIDPEQAQDWRNSFNKKDFERNKSERMKEKNEVLGYLESLEREGDFNTSEVESYLREHGPSTGFSAKEIEEQITRFQEAGKRSATDEATFFINQISLKLTDGTISADEGERIMRDTLKLYGRSVDGSVFNKTMGVIERAKNKEEERNRVLHNHKKKVLDLFPKALTARMVGDTPKEAKENLEELAKAVGKTDDPEKQVEILREFYDEWTPKLERANRIQEDIDKIIEENPNMTPEDLEQQIMKIMIPEIKKDVFRKTLGDRVSAFFEIFTTL